MTLSKEGWQIYLYWEICLMIPRLISQTILDPTWGRQMRFIVGPRQCGKTTLSKAILTQEGSSPKLYFDWDERVVRLRYQNDPDFLSEELTLYMKSKILPWVAFDEIHKYPKWKNVLKGIFDKHEPRLRLLVTGSARLDLIRRAGDSLSGRYFTYHLFPLCLRETAQQKKISIVKPLKSAKAFLEERFSNEKFYQSNLVHLLEAGGFPEPFLKNSKAFQRKWHMDFVDRLIRGDLRDMTRIEKLEHVAYLLRLIAERVGSPLSLNSLRETLEDSYNAVRNYR
ncbi:MAG: ATP-binding protein [Candidatus Omnitrophica bacterium]|nr:ATP-binding protein [Candidatus Omnitrophota bacterium]